MRQVLTTGMMVIIAAVLFLMISTYGFARDLLPIYAAMLLAGALVVLFGNYGDIVMRIIVDKVTRTSIPLGRALVQGGKLIVPPQKGERMWTGLAVVKLVPRLPAVFMSDKELEEIQKMTLQLITALPHPAEYLLVKEKDMDINTLINQLEAERKALERKLRTQQGPQISIDMEIREIKEIIRRLQTASSIVGGMYIVVHERAPNRAELEAKLDEALYRVRSVIQPMQVVHAEPLDTVRLYRFLEYRLLTHVADINLLQASLK